MCVTDHYEIELSLSEGRLGLAVNTSMASLLGSKECVSDNHFTVVETREPCQAQDVVEGVIFVFLEKAGKAYVC